MAPRFSVDRVYLYGSVLTDRWCPDSDLDLAVEGALSFGDLLKLWAELDGRLDREVDVRELTRLPFAEKVRAEEGHTPVVLGEEGDEALLGVVTQKSWVWFSTRSIERYTP